MWETDILNFEFDRFLLSLVTEQYIVPKTSINLFLDKDLDQCKRSLDKDILFTMHDTWHIEETDGERILRVKF